MKKLITVLLLGSLFIAQEIYTGHIVEDGDTLDVFSYQIPHGYTGDEPAALLLCYHHWNGNENSCYSTGFDEEADTRGWLFLSPNGRWGNHYHNQFSQYVTQQAIVWLQENYNIDACRIYMVGGSMGGAGGLVYANNHLDPRLPMTTAAVSGSGILDCERRYWEMDGNNSMIERFGGTPEEVPFVYHRNSAVFFEDLEQSMHNNLQHVPLYLDFSETEAHRYHAEDLYNLLLGYNPNMWIETEPGVSHGFGVLDEVHACDWLSQFVLIDDPDDVDVKLDEAGRAYWVGAENQDVIDQFIRIHAQRLAPESYHISEFSNAGEIIFWWPLLPGGTITLDNDVNGNIMLSAIVDDPLYLESVTLNGAEVDWIIADGYKITVFDYEFAPGQFAFHFRDLPLDVNGDGVWNVLDIITTLNFILGVLEPDDTELLAADLNNDGSLNILDVVAMVNLIIGTAE